MATYKVTMRITEGKARSQRRGEREVIRERILKLLTSDTTQDDQGRTSGGLSLVTLGSVRIRRVRKGV